MEGENFFLFPVFSFLSLFLSPTSEPHITPLAPYAAKAAAVPSPPPPTLTAPIASVDLNAQER